MCLSCGPGDPRPSIVLVTLDTLRRDFVGAYGSDRGLTPHLDALARQGIVYEVAYTTMPTTSPAHASLMTGLEPFQHGVRRNGVALRPALRPRVLAERLRGAGYATGAFVTTRLLGEPVIRFQGFDRYAAPEGNLWSGSAAAAAALRWLDEEPRRPFFLWLHVYDPHAPYGDAEDKRRSYPVDPRIHGFVDPARFTEEDRSRMAALYAKGVRDADAALGELLAGVRTHAPDPLIAVVADHGESLDEWLTGRGYAYDHGEFLEEGEIRIPLVIAGPGVTPGRSSAIASIRDSTHAAEAAGIGDPEARPRVGHLLRARAARSGAPSGLGGRARAGGLCPKRGPAPPRAGGDGWEEHRDAGYRRSGLVARRAAAGAPGDGAAQIVADRCRFPHRALPSHRRIDPRRPARPRLRGPGRSLAPVMGSLAARRCWEASRVAWR
jgi:arylsulfatase A-like enzyme